MGRGELWHWHSWFLQNMQRHSVHAFVCMCVCVWERERERERERIVGYVAACASLGSETVRLERVAITMFILSMCGCLLVQNRSAECVWLWLETNKKKTIQRIVSHFIVLFSYHQYFGWCWSPQIDVYILQSFQSMEFSSNLPRQQRSRRYSVMRRGEGACLS